MYLAMSTVQQTSRQPLTDATRPSLIYNPLPLAFPSGSVISSTQAPAQGAAGLRPGQPGRPKPFQKTLVHPQPELRGAPPAPSCGRPGSWVSGSSVSVAEMGREGGQVSRGLSRFRQAGPMLPPQLRHPATPRRHSRPPATAPKTTLQPARPLRRGLGKRGRTVIRTYKVGSWWGGAAVGRRDGQDPERGSPPARRPRRSPSRSARPAPPFHEINQFLGHACSVGNKASASPRPWHSSPSVHSPTRPTTNDLLTTANRPTNCACRSGSKSLPAPCLVH